MNPIVDSPRPQVLYLHGLLSSPLSHKAVFFQERLALRGVAAVIPDLNEGDFTTLTTRRAVALALRSAQDMAPRMVIFGSSFGGRVAAHAAARLGDRVAGLVLMAPALSLADVWARTQPATAMARWRDTRRVPLDHPVFGPVDLDYAFYEDALETDHMPTLPPDLPVLLLHGRQDDVVALDHSEGFARAHAATRLVVLEADHAFDGQDEALWAEVAPFLSEIGIPG